jgi:hypothetical protein
MKRFFVMAAIVLGTVALAAPAHASQIPSHTVSGTFTGTGTVDSLGGCAFHTTASATGTISPFGASTTVAVEFCPTGIIEPRPATGTFLITGGTGTIGGTLNGTVQGTDPTPDGFPYHFDLTLTSTTGEFAGATGSVALDGFFGFAALTFDGTASGTLFYGTPIATTRQDCANNGWRTLTDANGNPFRNIGQCIAVVSMRTP